MPYEHIPSDITLFGKTNFRNEEKAFGIRLDDRRRHMYVIGKTGMGKTTLMENMVIQDIWNGHGVCFMDPHGDSVERILNHIPPNRVNDVIYFNPADLAHPIAFNIMESVNQDHKHLVANGLMGVFTKIWANMWSSRMEYILNNTILALLDSPGNTMLGITRMYVDKRYRKKIVDSIRDPIVRSFWIDEYANYTDKFRSEAIAPIQNKVGQFLSSAIIRNIVGQPKSTIDMRRIMDEKKILILDLSKGKVGEDNSALLGAMIVTKIQLAAMSRTDIPEKDRSDFFLYVDEFQNFATESFATILSEARKYRLGLVVGHQYIAQLENDKNTKVRDAIFGNVGTMIVFRVGAADAEFLETEFAPIYKPVDIVNLPKYGVLLKLMINGVASQPFSAGTLPPNPKFYTGNAEKVIMVSRERYGNPVGDVEEKIMRWMGTEFHEEEAKLMGATDDRAPRPAVGSPVSSRPILSRSAPNIQPIRHLSDEDVPDENVFKGEARIPEPAYSGPTQGGRPVQAFTPPPVKKPEYSGPTQGGRPVVTATPLNPPAGAATVKPLETFPRPVAPPTPITPAAKPRFTEPTMTERTPKRPVKPMMPKKQAPASPKPQKSENPIWQTLADQDNNKLDDLAQILEKGISEN